jgi:DNA-binding transcriptional MerR regulator
MANHLLIGQAAKLLGATPKTLRHYEELGLIQPERLENRYRYYSASDLMRLERIRRLQDLGLSLNQIRILLDQMDREHLWRDVLQELLRKVKTQIQALEERRESIERMLESSATGAFENWQDPSATIELANDKLGQHLSEASPELWEQEKKLFGVLDRFQWTGEQNQSVKELVAYFVDHPGIYREMLAMAERIAALQQAPVDSPEINLVAQELLAFFQSETELLERMQVVSDLDTSLAAMLGELIAQNSAMSPAQQKLFAVLSSALER